MQLLRDPFLREVLWFSGCCRALSLLLQVLFNTLIPDHAADAFFPPRFCEPGLWDQFVEGLLGGLTHWDAEHFLFIAEHGYLFEHSFAFFPLFPLSVIAMAKLTLWPMQAFLCLRSRLVLAAVLLNCLFSTLAAGALYRLGCVVLQCRRMAFISALLFCLTPANVFMVAGYSESFFAFLAFGAMLKLEKGQNWISCLLFSLGTGVRSNGVINAGFIIHAHCSRLFRSLCMGIRSSWQLPLLLKMLCKASISMLLSSSIIIMPFVLFQYYAYLTFCHPKTSPEQVVSKTLFQLSVDKGYRMVDMNGTPPVWCSYQYPMVYSYIQDVYWNVGFLRYFDTKQIPNFLLATPVIVLSVCAAWTYVAANPWYCARLGLLRKGLEAKVSEKSIAGFCGHRPFVYIVHNSALLLFGLLYMHVQVSGLVDQEN
ncbi:GPI mannosyltransferase 2 isoform X2 [Ambystoma mexicanum]|uniref:GPI mannosyltransferase 2 isoform X2 n=1 Tax=Ambystoma mexicanum TaxID=8296 RepID=UPI0037E95BBF